MKLVIAITSHGRFDVVCRCVRSLAVSACHLLNHDVLFAFYPERGSFEDIKAEVLVYFKHFYLHPEPDTHQGCNRSIINMRRHAFEHLDATHVLTIDDDVVVTEGYLPVLMSALKWVGYGVVQSSVTFVGNPEHKRLKAHYVSHGFMTGSQALMSRAVWHRVQPTLDGYLEMLSSATDTEIRLWFRHLLKDVTSPVPAADLERYMALDCGTAADAALKVATIKAHVPTAHLHVNRAIMVSPRGYNMTPEQFDAFRNVRLDEIEGDLTRTHFTWKPV